MTAPAKFENTWFLTGGDLPDDFIRGVVETLGPPLFADNFDLSHFARLVLASASLTLLDKNIILENIPTLTPFQLDELIKVFQDEIEAFDSIDEYSTIAPLTTAGIFGAFCLANIRGAGYDDKEQEIAVIRAMTAKKLAENPDTHNLLMRIAATPLIKFFYPNLNSARPVARRVKHNKLDDTNFLMEI